MLKNQNKRTIEYPKNIDLGNQIKIFAVCIHLCIQMWINLWITSIKNMYFLLYF